MSAATIERGVATFNVNQNNSVKKQKADLRARMTPDIDVIFVQECVHLDLVAFAKKHKGWDAFQVRNGSNDGHANTGVLYRTTMGKVTDTDCVLIGDAADTRARFLTAVEFDHEDWYASFHIFPKRDTREIPAELKAITDWAKAHPGATYGCDKNQASIASLEKATGCKWHGIDIDGILTKHHAKGLEEFKPGFSDHPGVHVTLTVPAPATQPPTKPHPKPGPPKDIQPPSPPYVGPAFHTSAGENMPITRIVIHSTVSPCKPGGARQIGRYFGTAAAGGSAHYIVDPAETVQDVYDHVIAWHAPPNPHSLGIEMCDIPGPLPGDHFVAALWKAAKRVWRWARPEQQALLENTSKLTAELCAAYHVPPVFLGVRALKAGKHGVTTHNNVSQAWHQSTHWDPGFWPRRRFMRMVRKHYKQITK